MTSWKDSLFSFFVAEFELWLFCGAEIYQVLFSRYRFYYSALDTVLQSDGFQMFWAQPSVRDKFSITAQYTYMYVTKVSPEITLTVCHALWYSLFCFFFFFSKCWSQLNPAMGYTAPFLFSGHPWNANSPESPECEHALYTLTFLKIGAIQGIIRDHILK